MQLLKGRDIMEDRELLAAILSEMKDMKKDIAEIKSNVGGIETKVNQIETKVNQIETKVNQIETKVNQVDSKVDRNYDKTVEFYAMQQEHNTEVSDTLVTITGELEMHNNQIAKNTAAIRRYK